MLIQSKHFVFIDFSANGGLQIVHLTVTGEFFDSNWERDYY
jgi:hypothetical protein